MTRWALVGMTVAGSAACQEAVTVGPKELLRVGSIADVYWEDLSNGRSSDIAIDTHVACDGIVHAMMDCMWHLHERFVHDVMTKTALPEAEEGLVREAVGKAKGDPDGLLLLQYGIGYEGCWPRNWMAQRAATEEFVIRYAHRNSAKGNDAGERWRQYMIAMWGTGSDASLGLRPKTREAAGGEVLLHHALLSEDGVGCLPDILRAAAIIGPEDVLFAALSRRLRDWPDYMPSDGWMPLSITSGELAQRQDLTVGVAGTREAWSAALRAARTVASTMEGMGVRLVEAQPGASIRSIDERLVRFRRYNRNDIETIAEGCWEAVQALEKQKGVAVTEQARQKLIAMVIASARLSDSRRRTPDTMVRERRIAFAGVSATAYEWAR